MIFCGLPNSITSACWRWSTTNRLVKAKAAAAPTAARMAARRKDGHHARPALRLVDDHLVRLREHLLHHLEVEAPLGDLGREAIGVVDRGEALRLALCLRQDLLAIGLRLLDDALRLAARLGDDLVAVGLGLVAQALAVGLRALHVAEGVDDLRRRLDAAQLDLRDLDPGLVLVEDLLEQLLRIGLYRDAPLREGLLRAHVADDLAHRALCGGAHGALGREDVEDEGARVLDAPEDRVLDVEDVLVAGQHLPFLGAGHGAAARVAGGPEADVHGVDRRDRGLDHRLDRARQVVVPARAVEADGLAEAQHDADLVRLHDVEAAADPGDREDPEEGRDAAHAAEAAAARQHVLHLLLRAPDQVLDVGGLATAEGTAAAATTSTATATARRPPPRALAAAAAARTASPGTSALRPRHRE
jgi:hypothetical protein